MFNFKKSKDIKPLNTDIVNKGYIPLVGGSFNILAGEGGVGKSLLAIKSCIIYLLDHKEKNAYMAMTEDGINECISRAKTICSQMGIDYYKEIDSRIFWITVEEIDVPKLAYRENGTVVQNETALGELCKSIVINDIGFLCLDPLRAFHELEENSNSEMPKLTRDILPKIGKLTGATILVLHHSAKGEGSGVRGASSIANDARSAWVVSKAVVKNKMTGKVEEKEEFKGKVVLSVYKDNYGLIRECKIRDNNNMIKLPIEVEVKYEETKYEMPTL